MLRTLRDAYRHWTKDNASFLGAALAYYALFSVAPLLIIVIAVAGLAFGEAAVEGRVVSTLEEFVGRDSAQAVQTLVKNARHAPDSWPAAAVGIVALVVAALGLFRQLKTALNMIWKLPPEKHSQGWLGFLRDYLLALLMVLLTGAFVLVLVASSSVLAFLRNALGKELAEVAPVWQATDFAAMVALFTLLLAFTFRFLSGGRLRYRDLWGGAFVAALLFALGKFLFGMYLAYSSVSTVYGAAGSLVVFLVWIYYSAQIVFFGAEVVHVRVAARRPAPDPQARTKEPDTILLQQPFLPASRSI